MDPEPHPGETGTTWPGALMADGESTYHLELNNVTLHFFEEEWTEFLELLRAIVKEPQPVGETETGFHLNRQPVLIFALRRVTSSGRALVIVRTALPSFGDPHHPGLVLGDFGLGIKRVVGQQVGCGFPVVEG